MIRLATFSYLCAVIKRMLEEHHMRSLKKRLQQVFLFLYVVLFIGVYVVQLPEMDNLIEKIENQLAEHEDAQSNGLSIEDEVEVNDTKIPTFFYPEIHTSRFDNSLVKNKFSYSLDYQGLEFDLISPPPQLPTFC